MTATHFEPFVHLADLTHEHALVAWGGFFFDLPGRHGSAATIVEDDHLGRVAGHDGRVESIGARSAPYGRAQVEVLDAATGEVVAGAATEERNHVWVEGLEPDTEYRYRIRVDGRPWAEDALYDWARRDGHADLVRTDRRYEQRFRTFPDPGRSASLRFAVLGDYGVGILAPEGMGKRQLRLGEALDRAVRSAGVRLVVTTGDNVYLGDEGSVAGSGAQDDDWYYSFYQPYRYSIPRVPFFPGVGNHDTVQTEVSDDRGQLSDNFYTDQRFRSEVASRRASVDPGLYYRFSYGAGIEFVCIDTTEARTLEDDRYFFQEPHHRRFLEESFPATEEVGRGPVWRIPFSHHPPYCAGPSHHDFPALAEVLTPLLRRAGVRVMLSGHEHNFQHNRRDGVEYVVTGAAGKLREERPGRLGAVGNRSWAAEGHLLVVDVDAERIVLHPVTDVAAAGRFTYLRRAAPDGRREAGPIVIEKGER